jgi:hypothetical protein
MIRLLYFTYTDEQWKVIKAIVRVGLGRDADNARVLEGPLRGIIEVEAGMYYFKDDDSRQRPRRDELIALRKDALKLRDNILDAFTAPVATEYGVSRLVRTEVVDAGMMTASRAYFTKLLHTLDRMIERTGDSRDNARKTARDSYWSELLAVWCELGGKRTGKAVARFLIAASKPVGAGASIKTVLRWLERRQKKTPRSRCGGVAQPECNMRQTSPDICC